MYTLLSYLPTLVLPSKIPYARYVKEHIFDRLGMNSTTFSFERANATGELATGMARESINSTGNPLERGIVRPLPFWSTSGGEDGNGQYLILSLRNIY